MFVENRANGAVPCSQPWTSQWEPSADRHLATANSVSRGSARARRALIGWRSSDFRAAQRRREALEENVVQDLAKSGT